VGESDQQIVLLRISMGDQRDDDQRHSGKKNQQQL
jgi:hypothetical protein